MQVSVIVVLFLTILQEEFTSKVWNPAESALQAKAARELERFNSQHKNSKLPLVSYFTLALHPAVILYMHDLCAFLCLTRSSDIPSHLCFTHIRL